MKLTLCLLIEMMKSDIKSKVKIGINMFNKYPCMLGCWEERLPPQIYIGITEVSQNLMTLFFSTSHNFKHYFLFSFIASLG